ncbi:MAG TPA: hypothetical protein VG937_17930 [Polyangiaceae bacterium]|nr:hypothetical protein [Polyangiaceae bacterium]
MTAPKPWLNDPSELSALERRVLRSGERMAAPRGSKQQIWLSLAARLPLAAVASGSPALGSVSAPKAALVDGAAHSAGLGSAASGAKGAMTAAVLKALAVGFALGAATMGAATWLAPNESQHHASPAPVRATPKPAAAPDPAAPPLQLEQRAEPTAANEARPRRAARSEADARSEAEAKTTASIEPERAPVDPSAARAAFPEPVQALAPLAAPTPASARDRARLESQRVAQARALLHSGDPRGALALLQSVASEFPSGVLVQEREALTIDALLASGDRENARRRASDFVQRYPDSPHAPAVQRALR